MRPLDFPCSRFLGPALLLAVSTACRSGSDDDPVAPPPPPPVDDVEFVAPPAELFTLGGEVLAVTPCCRRDDTVEKARIPIDALQKFEYRELYLTHHHEDLLEPIPFELVDDAIIADLRGGETYVVIAIVPRWIDVYKALCLFDHFVLRDIPRLIDPICTRILCSGELFEADVLYEEFPETRRYREQLRFEEEPLLLGGFGPGDDVCERCTQWRGTGHLYPHPGCFDRPTLPPPAGPSWSATVIDMMPLAQSAETFQDSEPHLAIDAANTDHMVGTAFTQTFGGTLAPVYVTNNGGTTWILSDIVNSSLQTLDIAVDSGGDADDVYAGILRNPLASNNPPVTDYRVQFTADAQTAATMTDLNQRDGPDQPWIEVQPNGADDRLYVSQNDLGLAGTQTASVDVSLDSGTSFTSVLLEPRATGGQDAPSVRTAVAPNGVVYAAYLGWRSITNQGGGVFSITTDVVVARDDDGDATTNAFADLLDANDGLAGQIVVTGRGVVFDGSARLGQNRVGSTLSLAVDPSDSNTVYLAWAEQDAQSDSTVRVRRSTDGGQTWSADLRTVASTINVALAVTGNGTVGFLRQSLVTVNGQNRWATVVDLSAAGDFSDQESVALASTPANAPVAVFQPYLGDYAMLRAVGNDEFRGVFSANNTPDLANFPSGVTFQRVVDLGNNVLQDQSGNTVATSIDPFFFRVERNP